MDESPIRAAILEEGLREAGLPVSSTSSLLARIYALDPDVILIDLENPSRSDIAGIWRLSRSDAVNPDRGLMEQC